MCGFVISMENDTKPPLILTLINQQLIFLLSAADECLFQPFAVTGALPQGYAVLVHGLLVLVDSHQEIPQDAVQDTVALVGQGIPQQGNPILILLLSACSQAKILL